MAIFIKIRSLNYKNKSVSTKNDTDLIYGVKKQIIKCLRLILFACYLSWAKIFWHLRSKSHRKYALQSAVMN